MRRNVLITTNSLYLLLAGLATGIPLAVGSLITPLVFAAGDIKRSTAESLVAALYDASGLLVSIILAIMLALAVFEAFYRKRVNTRLILKVRIIINVLALTAAVYISMHLQVLLRQYQKYGPEDLYTKVLNSFLQAQWVVVFLSVALVVITQAANIGPRRDGGHPRQV